MVKNSNSNNDAVQGAGVIEEPNLANIEKWLTADIGRAITLLRAIQEDTELRRQMAVWFEGRINNAKHKADPSKINQPG